MLEKTKSFLLGISALILVGFALLRLISANDWTEVLFGFFIIVWLGTYGIYEIFQTAIRSSSFYRNHEKLLIKYQELINSMFLLSVIIILLIVLGANNSPSAFFNYLKYFLIILFLIGGGLIGFNAFRKYTEKAKGL